MANDKVKCNKATLIGLIIVALLSIGGLLTSFHLVDLHYTQPGRTELLMARYPVLKALKSHVPKKYLVPMVAPVILNPPKSAAEELTRQYDPYSAYINKPSDGDQKPAAPPAKEKTTCESGKTVAGIEETCYGVDKSKYSQIAGIGVSIFGVAGYLIMLVLCIVALIQRSAKPSIIVMLMYLGSFIGLGFSLYLTYLEVYVIKYLCPYCMRSAEIMAVIFVIMVVGFSKGIFKRLLRKA